MATLTRGKTFTVNEEVTNAKLHQLVDSGGVSGIIDTDFLLSSANAIAVASSAPGDNDQKVWYDNVNGALKYRDASNNFQSVIDIEQGTKMLFQQTAAPTGWTKDATHNDKALRIVSGSVTTGGSVAFSTALGTPSVSGTIDGHALTEAEMPSHTHSLTIATGGGGGTINDAAGDDATSTTTAVAGTIGNTGSGSTHNHTFSSGTATINCQYVDVIIASKD